MGHIIDDGVVQNREIWEEIGKKYISESDVQYIKSLYICIKLEYT